ncbi:2-isopropylmalate synthase [Alicyclobacillus acidiphilus]|uniref:2-isopropylmalate synthase n=1 Tax=Alicyclobacillus acidiphilus TaxID=182455 RepID=UPI000829E37A|nr:2-isopropylmalate synthase [Alicyclobacillus acidiphilus]
MKRITIFDTTLRDGEQAPGASLYPQEKILVARQLERLGVDVIEPGFPISSPGEFAAVQQISRMVQRAEVCGFARAIREDIDSAVRATQDAARRRLHLFISSSQIHLDFQLRKTQREVLQMARDMVAYAKQFVDRIEFSPMDASRTGDEFLCEMVEAVIEEGATIINLPDTVGYSLPAEYGAMFAKVRKLVRGGDKVEYSAHCHNDLGLAVANSLAAIENGATHVEVTVNGVGERTGNCSLEELVMAIATRGDALGIETGIRTEEIYETSRLVSRMMNFPIAFNKPIVGRNAFQHESGIHQDGLLKNRKTYEIMDPAKMGVPRSMIVLGKHSGRHALKHRMSQYGAKLSDAGLDTVYHQFKALADARKHVSDEDLLALVDGVIDGNVSRFALVDLDISKTADSKRVARVAIRDNEADTVTSYSETGDGPVEAVVGAIKQAMPMSITFADLELHSLSSTERANGEAAVTVVCEGETYRGVGIDEDVIEAVAKAFLSACNQAVAAQNAQNGDTKAEKDA